MLPSGFSREFDTAAPGALAACKMDTYGFAITAMLGSHIQRPRDFALLMMHITFIVYACHPISQGVKPAGIGCTANVYAHFSSFVNLCRHDFIAHAPLVASTREV